MMSGYARKINGKERRKEIKKIITKDSLAFSGKNPSLKISKGEAVRKVSKPRLFRISRAHNRLKACFSSSLYSRYSVFFFRLKFTAFLSFFFSSFSFLSLFYMTIQSLSSLFPFASLELLGEATSMGVP